MVLLLSENGTFQMWTRVSSVPALSFLLYFMVVHSKSLFQNCPFTSTPAGRVVELHITTSSWSWS